METYTLEKPEDQVLSPQKIRARKERNQPVTRETDFEKEKIKADNERRTYDRLSHDSLDFGACHGYQKFERFSCLSSKGLNR